MSFDYAAMAATALRLLESFGQDVVLKRFTGNSIDPVTGATVAGTDASVTTTGIMKLYASNMIDGTRILATDRELVLSNEQVPVQTDTVTIDGEDWSIVAIKPVSPAGTDLVYFVQVRK